MSRSLPSNMFLQHIWEPLECEYNINDFVVLGEIPKELNGTFYRNGPNPPYVYSKKYHMFEGDSMIHAIPFKNRQHEKLIIGIRILFILKKTLQHV